MFDLTAESTKRPLREPSLGSKVAAILAHGAGLIALVAVPVAHVVRVQPETPPIQAFVAMPETLLPPPAVAPPAPAPAAKGEPVPGVQQSAAPVPTEPPVDVQPERNSSPEVDAGVGQEGGVEGGVSGGVVGGVVGGVGTVAPVPAALPPPPAPSPALLRMSGPLKKPNLLHRVDPVYAAIAAASRIHGEVVLEAVVDVNGSIESIRVLRGRSPLLDNAATEALKQWKYAPLVLAGIRTPFRVTVTFNFTIPTA